jgi:hypothetical protein
LFQENQGPSAARNTGIRRSKGEFLMFLDADDIIRPEKLEIQAKALDAHPEWGLVYSGWDYVDESGEKILATSHPYKQGRLLKDWLLRTFFFPSGTALIRRECFQTCGLFDETLWASEDTDFWVRLALAGYAFGYVEEALFQYRVVPRGITSNIHNQIKYEFLRLDKFFARSDLERDILSLKPKAYGVLMFEASARCYCAGEIELARTYLKEAIKTCPELEQDKNWLVEWLAGVALDPRVSCPEQLLATIFDNLPAEAATLRKLRRKALGRYHTAAAFSEFHNRNYRSIRSHIPTAILGDPAILLNRGFIRIALQSLFP